MPEAYREIDKKFFDAEDTGWYLEEYINEYQKEPNPKDCDYYPVRCRKCKLRSVCKLN
jgi:CRISPR/Cas system-associated exonuclease Cas4 (RecB family)